MWTLPILIFAIGFLLAIPLGLYMARVFEGQCRIAAPLRWIESRVNTGPQNWKQYCVAFMLFNVVTFVVGLRFWPRSLFIRHFSIRTEKACFRRA